MGACDCPGVAMRPGRDPTTTQVVIEACPLEDLDRDEEGHTCTFAEMMPESTWGPMI